MLKPVRALMIMLSCLALSCAAAAPRRASVSVTPVPSAENARTTWDVETEEEERVLRIAEGIRKVEQRGPLYDRERTRRFIEFAERRLAEGVRGDACRWLISHARVSHRTLGLDTAEGVFRLEPDEEHRLLQLALLRMSTCNRTPP